MRRGTTPTIKFHLKNKDGSAFDTALITDMRVTFKQWGVTILEKKIDGCSLADGCIIVSLTQEETLLFNEEREVKVQAKLKLTSGKVVATKCVEDTCAEIFNEEVL